MKDGLEEALCTQSESMIVQGPASARLLDKLHHELSLWVEFLLKRGLFDKLQSLASCRKFHSVHFRLLPVVTFIAAFARCHIFVYQDWNAQGTAQSFKYRALITHSYSHPHFNTHFRILTRTACLHT